MSQLRNHPLRLALVAISVLLFATTIYLRNFRADDGPTPAELACTIDRTMLRNAVDSYERRFRRDGSDPFGPSTGVGGPTIADLRADGYLTEIPEYYTLSVLGSIEVTEDGETVGCS